MKNRILRLLCILFVLNISLVHTPLIGFADTDAGKMASVYGYVLDDYLRTYGVISDEDVYKRQPSVPLTSTGFL